MLQRKVPSHDSKARPKTFLGLSLAGGKTDKSCLVVLDFYKDQNKIFLTKIHEKIKNEDALSSDLKLFELINQHLDRTEYLALDVPWELPSCLRCELSCPGYENCKEPHISWMWDYYYNHRVKKRPQKVFTPYTQRCVEFYLHTELEEKFTLSHAMGANAAPLMARAKFLVKRLREVSPVSLIEVYPKLSVWRMGTTLGALKSNLRAYKHASYGEQARRSILHSMLQKNIVFIYEQDKKTLIENGHSFDAFLLALTAYLKFQNLTEQRPTGFPASEPWIEFPQKDFKFPF
ncbi:MAG: DUF429 domain-containing protein [Pseudobdellovibrionaceae bacterium]